MSLPDWSLVVWLIAAWCVICPALMAAYIGVALVVESVRSRLRRRRFDREFAVFVAGLETEVSS